MRAAGPWRRKSNGRPEQSPPRAGLASGNGGGGVNGGPARPMQANPTQHSGGGAAASRGAPHVLAGHRLRAAQQRSTGRAQKSSSVVKTNCSYVGRPDAATAMTPAFWYSPTRRSKKFVLPCRLMSSIQSNGLTAPYSLS